MTPRSAAETTTCDLLLAEAGDEFLERIERGEDPQIDEYIERYPQIAETLREVLPALRLMGTIRDGPLLSSGLRGRVRSRGSHPDDHESCTTCCTTKRNQAETGAEKRRPEIATHGVKRTWRNGE